MIKEITCFDNKINILTIFIKKKFKWMQFSQMLIFNFYESLTCKDIAINMKQDIFDFCRSLYKIAIKTSKCCWYAERQKVISVLIINLTTPLASP